MCDRKMKPKYGKVLLAGNRNPAELQPIRTIRKKRGVGGW